MIEKYALSIEYAGWDNEMLTRHFVDGDSPMEVVEFYAKKFDFTTREDFLVYRKSTP